MNVSEILTQLTSHGFEDTSTDDKVAAINDALWDIESREPWPFLEKTTQLSFNGSSPTPSNMPTDFKAALWIYDNTNGVSIWPERASTIRDTANTQINLVSDPQAYYFVGNTIKFWPVPGAATNRYQMDYIATQPAITSTSVEADILLPKRHHKVITLGALWQLYKMEDDPENGNMFQIDYENKINLMAEDLFRRQYQRADRIFVVDEDDIIEY